MYPMRPDSEITPRKLFKEWICLEDMSNVTLEELHGDLEMLKRILQISRVPSSLMREI